ncbi:hypothetical protein D3C71_1908720 [compost metagenome]
MASRSRKAQRRPYKHDKIIHVYRGKLFFPQLPATRYHFLESLKVMVRLSPQPQTETPAQLLTYSLSKTFATLTDAVQSFFS